MRKSEVRMQNAEVKRERGRSGTGRGTGGKKCALVACFCSVFFPGAVNALPQEPWLGDIYEFFFDGSYTFSYWRRVADAVQGPHHRSNDNNIFLGIGFTGSDNWDVDLEVEFAKTTELSFNWQSLAGQWRYLWLNDVIGDPVSLITGISLRGVHHRNLKDISCPYAAEVNLEGHLSVGKEHSCGPLWCFRGWAFGAVGIANRGSPWTRLQATFEVNRQDKHQFDLFSRADFGFGRRHKINIDHFNGYASIRTRSVEVGAGYRYLFEIWGELRFEYVRRVYAKAAPDGINYFTVWYHLPFSIF